jgi:chorismate mutase / prephenate dehydratase
MGNSDTPLADLRLRIDRIDEQIHDLVMSRAALVDEIRRNKDRNGAPIIQPQREIAVLRRLAARHRGAFPFPAVTRIWREMISALTQMQQPIAVAVYAPGELPGAWDLARDHFGSVMPMSAYQTIGQVFRAVTDRPATIGVVPMPQEHDPDPWWRQLLSGDSTVPRVFARLPVVERGNARGTNRVLAIGCDVGDFSDVDHSLMVIEIGIASSRMKVISSLGAAGFGGALIDVSSHDGVCLVLVELDGPVALDDPRFGELAAQLGTPIERVYHLGGYSDPVLPPGATHPV